jgi:hypothetical protein
MRSLPLVFGLVAACGGASDGTTPGKPSPPQDAETGSEPETGGSHAPQPSWGSDEVRAAVQAALDLGIPEPGSIRDTYLHMFDAWADGDCPTGDGYNLPGDYEGCETLDGAWFYGHGEYEDALPYADVGFYLLGDCFIVDPDGARFEAAGELELVAEEVSGTRAIRGMVLGTWGYPGEEGFLTELTQNALFLQYETNGDDRRLTLDGSWGSSAADIMFRAFELHQRTCPDLLRGEMMVREPNGYWHSIQFDGACGGCGTMEIPDSAEPASICIDIGVAGEVVVGSLEQGVAAEP